MPSAAAPRGMIDTRCTGSAVGERERDQRVAHLVDGHDLALPFADDAALALEPGHHAVDGLLELDHLDAVLLAAGGEQRGLVDHVGQVGAREPRRPRGDHVQVHVRAERHAAGVHLEDVLAAPEVGPVHDDLAVEPPRPHERRVEHVVAVGRGHDDHARARSRTRPSPPAAGSASARARRASPSSRRSRPRGPCRSCRSRRGTPARGPSPWPAGTARGRAPRRGRRTSPRTPSPT